MFSSAARRTSRIATIILPAILVAGCFGEGEGPTPLAGTPAPPPPEIPEGFCDVINFEDVCGPYTFTDFEGGAVAIIDNPDMTGNMSEKVARMQKFEVVGGGTFGGSTLTLPGGVDFSKGEAFTMQVWSSRAVPVLFKFEGLDQERSADNTGGSAWQEMCFDFTGTTSGPAATGLTIIFDLTVMGDAAGDPNKWTFYFDEITQVDSCGSGGSGGTPLSLPITFDDSGIDYELQDFGGAVTTLVADPADGANTVASSNKPPGAESWGGTTVANVSGFGALPFSATDTTMTLRVYSPDAGIPVRLKVEDRNDSTISVETQVDTTTANAWETLTFDFSNEVSNTPALNLANTYDKASVFFNFGTDGNTAGDKTYLWDDLTFVTGGGSPAITLPVTFEDGDSTFYEIQDFGGAVTTLVADPADGANMVASSNKPPGAESWGGTTVANVSGFGALPFSATDTTMTLRVYSPDAGIPVRLKVEDRNDSTISVETQVDTTTANAWETLTFDFSNEVSNTPALNLANTYDKASVFFNFGTDGNTAGDKTYLWDDLTFVTGGGSGGGGGMTSTDFESGGVMFSDFGGAASAVVANPDASGINTSSMVGQSQKFAGETFAGTTIDLGGPVDLAAADSYTMKVRAQRSVVVTFKLEMGGQETTATHSGSGTWEELCFDFTGITGPVTGITIIFDNGTAGDAAGDPDNWTFQYDDIQQLAGSCPAPAFKTITFDDPAVTYTLTDFGGNSSSVTNDPAGGSNQVAQAVKTDTAETWAGTTVSTEGNNAVPTIPLDASNTIMSVRVYSPDAGIPVRLKVEDAANSANSVEAEVQTTVANAWETLIFDFANQAPGSQAFDESFTYNKISIFFNFNTSGATAGEKTYYFDDISFVGGSGSPAITLPVTFEDGDSTFYEIQDFGGAVTTLVADPADGANTVASSNKPPGAESWGGTTVANVSGFGALPFSATDTTMTLRVYSPDAGIPVRLKVEDRNDDTISVETQVDTTMANAWETLTFDFSNEVSNTPALNLANTYDKASVFFNFGTDGNTAGDKTYLWDDLTFVTGGGSAFVNGDFETGDFTGWTTTQIPDSVGSVAIDASGQGGRAGSVARLMAEGSANPAQGNDVLLSQVALAAGTVSAGDTISVSFDLYGSLEGAGGVVFVEVIFLDSNGQDVGGRDFVGPAAPYTPTTTWTNYSGDVIAGTAVGGGQYDVSGGVTLQLKAACGAVDGCAVDASFDNVTFTINQGAAAK